MLAAFAARFIGTSGDGPGPSAAVAELLKKEGEAFRPCEAEKDQRRRGGYAEDDEDASEEFVSVKDGLKS